MENKLSFKQRLTTMLKVDMRRVFTTPIFYIFAGISLVIPVLILVMTSMMDGMVSVNPQTGVETVMEGFENVWQIIGSTTPTDSMQGMDMGLTSMCNINLLYFMVAVMTCLFISADFSSGYVKNLFTVRAQKSDYVISKIVTNFVCSIIIFLLFFVGAIIGGAIAKLPFVMEGFDFMNLLWCMLGKIFLCLIFVSVCTLASSFGKSKSWLSIIIACAFSMLFFTMIPMITPINSTPINFLLCAVGGVLFSIGLCYASKKVLDKSALI